MELLERRVYRGPSLYAHFPVMRLTVDLGVLESWPSAKIPGFNDGLLTALPTLRAHTCSFETEGVSPRGRRGRVHDPGRDVFEQVFEHGEHYRPAPTARQPLAPPISTTPC